MVWTRWVGLFATAARRAVADANAFEERVQSLELTWRERLGRVRAGSAADLLLRRLPGAPILTVQSAADLIGRSVQATNEAIARLAEAKVLSQTTVGRRNRAFEAPELISAFTDLERQLASPSGDTRTAPPRAGAAPRLIVGTFGLPAACASIWVPKGGRHAPALLRVRHIHRHRFSNQLAVLPEAEGSATVRCSRWPEFDFYDHLGPAGAGGTYSSCLHASP